MFLAGKGPRGSPLVLDDHVQGVHLLVGLLVVTAGRQRHVEDRPIGGGLFLIDLPQRALATEDPLDLPARVDDQKADKKDIASSFVSLTQT